MEKIILLHLMLMTSIFFAACDDDVVYNDKFFPKTEPVDDGELPSIISIQENLKTLAEKAKDLSDEKDAITQLSDLVKELYNRLNTLDLSAAGPGIAITDSQRFHQFLRETDGALAKIDTGTAKKLWSEIQDLSDTANAHRDRRPDVPSIRNLWAQIDKYPPLAQKIVDAIAEIKRELIEQRDAIKRKIDSATSNFVEHFGDKAADLDSVVALVNDATSLQQLKNVFLDNRFVDLGKEVRDSAPGALYFRQLADVENFLHGDGQTQRSIVEKAIALRTDIDDKFLANAPDQSHIDRLARSMDSVLKNDSNELAAYANTRGIVLAQDRRSKAIREMLAPIPGPPILGVAIPLNVEKQITDYKTYIEVSVYENRVIPARNKITGAGLNHIRSFYDAAKFAAIVQAVQDASDLASYIPNYQRLFDAILPYTVPRLMALLREDDAETADDEVKFAENFQKLRPLLHTNLMHDLSRLKNERINLLISDWLLQFNNLPTIQTIEQKKAELNALTQSNAASAAPLLATCNDLSTLLANPLPCATIVHNFRSEIASGEQVQILSALGNAKLAITNAFDPLLELVRTAKSKSDFLEAFQNFNRLFDAAHSMAAVVWNPAQMYTVASLIADLENHLKTKVYNSFTYEHAINSYASQLNPAMGAPEIDLLRRQFGQPIRTSLERRLRNMLSNNAYESVIRFFNPPDEKARVAFMKKAALADNNGAGIPAFEKALQQVYEAGDELNSRHAVNHLATFFKDSMPAHQLMTNIRAAAVLPAINPTLNEERDQIKELVEHNPRYIALRTLSDIAPNTLHTYRIKASGPPPDTSFETLFARLTDDMKKNIFGEAPHMFITEFDELKQRLVACLLAIKAQVPVGVAGLTKNPVTIDPIVNAFALLFLDPLTKLDGIGAYDPAVDHQLQRIVEDATKDSFVADYLPKFKKFSSVVGENELVAPFAERPIITLLKSIRAKIRAATSVTPEIGQLRIYIDEGFLH